MQMNLVLVCVLQINIRKCILEARLFLKKVKDTVVTGQLRNIVNDNAIDGLGIRF